MTSGGMSLPVILYTALMVVSSVTRMASSADSCIPDPCAHGSCFSGPNGQYRCVCQPGWNGTDCQIAASTTSAPDPCLSNPCPQGTCARHGTNFTCTACQSGYTGPNCNQVVTSSDPCTPSPCMHGSCFSSGSTFFCQCSQGYTGKTCNTAATTPAPCSSTPCIHGSCTNQGSSYTCTCTNGWAGTNCDQVSVSDPCQPNPCIHGTCFGSGANFLCQCTQGYMGKTCSASTDPCSNNPCVNGVCFHHNNDFVCQCPTGYIGKTCSQRADECSSSPCVHGQCYSSGSSHICQCDPNYTGANCDQHTDQCTSHPCVHGTCFASTSGHVCTCQTGYTGLNCDTPIGPCDSSPCRQGSCLSHGHDYVCQCQSGWTGKDCDVNMSADPCYSNPCVHGSCFSSASGYMCQCPAGFTGQNCDQPDDPCTPDPCSGHGNCARASGGSGYVCTCFYGYTGVTCATASGGFIINPGDCVVSPWGQWSVVSGFGTQDRQRIVITSPSSGGKPCPSLSEIRHTTTSPSVPVTATNMVSGFVTPSGTGSTGYGQLRDLLIILDSSTSIGVKNFTDAKTQLSRLVALFCPSPDPFAGDHQKAALLVYNSRVYEIFDFNDLHNTKEVQAKILSVTFTDGITLTEAAFEYARTHMLSRNKGMRFRADVKQEVLLITDGESNHPADTIKAAKELQQYATVYALAIGSISPEGQKEISGSVSTPPSVHLFSIPGFGDLKTLVDEIARQVHQAQCARFEY
ncbi:fibropellin-1-like isoform X2 [Mya arenaria]|uniref:fibropellin-1-like isoform X2 n=1 Tax=Mya arenaria TaxID=6604 RepID=UPI0022E00FEE|nr:fibropellin-1-like isoform X2 [Mya arenaria]